MSNTYIYLFILCTVFHLRKNVDCQKKNVCIVSLKIENSLYWKILLAVKFFLYDLYSHHVT